ncbi:MAG: hypothetical protein KAW09_03800 [Thermoplasmata archaeon]|nr:hypothetical protein [Thermoplasmata archaeon]
MAKYPVRKDGTHVVTLDYEFGGHSGSLSGTFEADISAPDLSISVREDETGMGQARIRVTSSESLARQWIDDKPIRFAQCGGPFPGVDANEMAYPVQVVTQGREIHVVKHECNHQIIYIKSNDLGMTWEDYQIVANAGWPGYGKPHAPSLAVEGGIVHVTWHSNPQGPQGGDIWYRRSINGVWEEPIMISEDHRALYASSVSAYQGIVHVAWTDKRDYPVSAQASEIYYKRSPSSGTTWEGATRLTDEPFYSWNPVIHATESGIHLVWDDARNTESRFVQDVYYMRFDGWLWSPEKRLTPSSSLYSFPKISGSGNLLQITTSYPDSVFSAERSLNGGLTWDDGLGNENTPREIADGFENSLDSSGRTAKGAFFTSAQWPEKNFFGWAGNVIWSGDTQNAGGDWSTERITGPIMRYVSGNDGGPKVGQDFLEEPIVVWDDYFGLDRYRFLYYTRYVEPRIRMTAPDGTTSTIPLTSRGNDWEASVKFEQMGLYTVEAIGFDAAGNTDTALAFLGRLEWDSGGDIETHVSAHKDWAFQEAKLGLRSLYVLTEGPEQVDQFQDRFSPYGYQGLWDKDHVHAQSFRPSYPTVSSVNLYLMKTPGFIGDVVVEVRTDDETGFPSDRVLISTLLFNNEISTTGGWVHVDFPTIPVVTDNTYHIVLRLTETQSPGWPTNYLGWKLDQEHIDYYVRGRGTYNHAQGWISFPNNADRIFKVYTTTAQPTQSDQRVDHTDGSFWELCRVYTLLAQSFKPSHTSISEIELKLVTAHPSLDEDIWVEIREDNAGDPTGEVLTRAMISGGDIPYQVPDWVLIDFADTPLNLDETYHIVLTWATEPEDDILYWLADTGDIYVHGHATTHTSGGGYYPQVNDLLFRTHTKSARAEATDQHQERTTDIGFGLVDGMMHAQSFVPAYGTVTAIDISLMNYLGSSPANVIVEIRDSDPVTGHPTSEILTRSKVLNAEIPQSSFGFVHVDFSDVRVTPGEKYHIVLWADGGPGSGLFVEGHYSPYDNGFDAYPQGEVHFGLPWQLAPGWDAVFRIHTKSAYSEVADQIQECTTSTAWDLGDGEKYAQSFVPAYGTVTAIDISLMNYLGSSPADVIVEIRESDPVTGHPVDEILTTSRIANGDIPQSSFGFVHVDFADVKVTPDEKYHIIWWADGLATFLSIETHYNQHANDYDAYPRGEMHYGLGPPWQAAEGRDARFRTYSRSPFEGISDAWLEVGTSDSIHEWEHIGIFIGSEETGDLYDAVNDYLGGFFGIPDVLGYIRTPFTFHSETPGSMLVWTTRLEFT